MIKQILINPDENRKAQGQYEEQLGDLKKNNYTNQQKRTCERIADTDGVSEAKRMSEGNDTWLRVVSLHR